MRIVLLVLFAIALHVTLGWIPAVIVAVVAGYWVRTWWSGVLALSGSWLALVLFNLYADFGAQQAMVDVVGGLLGGVPGTAVFGLSLLVSALLGGLAAYVGLQLRALRSARVPY